jgi:hypothetical protein
MALILQCCKSLPLRNVTKACQNCSLSENNARWRRISVSCCLLVANKLVGRCRPRSQKCEACLSCPTDLGVAFSDLSVKKRKTSLLWRFLDWGPWCGKLESKERNKTFKSMCRFRLQVLLYMQLQLHRTTPPNFSENQNHPTHHIGLCQNHSKLWPPCATT